MSRKLVLLSGGQDSATCLAAALSDSTSMVHAVVFDYGQRHRIEISYSKRLAACAGVPIQVIDCPFLAQFNDNSLTDRDRPIRVEGSSLPSTFVPGRNMLFLTLAGIMAYQLKCDTLVTGVCQTDFSGYPDCRHAFIQTFNKALNLALDRSITVSTPLMWLTKAETVLFMARLGKLAWYEETHTCYEGKRPACGECPSCILRLKGFEEAGIADPLSYEGLKV